MNPKHHAPGDRLHKGHKPHPFIYYSNEQLNAVWTQIKIMWLHFEDASAKNLAANDAASIRRRFLHLGYFSYVSVHRAEALLK